MRKVYLPILLSCLLLSACQEEKKPKATMEQAEEDIAIQVDQKDKSKITVDLINNDGTTIGEATLHEDVEGVTISIEASELPPGLRGFHIHERGVCEEPNFESAGGHFNPDGKSHGIHHEDGPHAGDLPNLNVKDDGTVKVKYINNKVTLEEDSDYSLRGESGSTLIIHSDKDDGISQPAGDAGERIVCGVINEPHK